MSSKVTLYYGPLMLDKGNVIDVDIPKKIVTLEFKCNPFNREEVKSLLPGLELAIKPSKKIERLMKVPHQWYGSLLSISKEETFYQLEIKTPKLNLLDYGLLERLIRPKPQRPPLDNWVANLQHAEGKIISQIDLDESDYEDPYDKTTTGLTIKFIDGSHLRIDVECDSTGDEVLGNAYWGKVL